MSNKELLKREREQFCAEKSIKIYNENAIKVCQKIQTAEKRGNVSFRKA